MSRQHDSRQHHQRDDFPSLPMPAMPPLGVLTWSRKLRSGKRSKVSRQA